MARSGIGRSPIADCPTKRHRLRVPRWTALRLVAAPMPLWQKGSGTNLRPEWHQFRSAWSWAHSLVTKPSAQQAWVTQIHPCKFFFLLFSFLLCIFGVFSFWFFNSLTLKTSAFLFFLFCFFQDNVLYFCHFCLFYKISDVVLRLEWTSTHQCTSWTILSSGWAGWGAFLHPPHLPLFIPSALGLNLHFPSP
jgi:hypothetical protein